MTYCDFDALERTPLERDPYDYRRRAEFPAAASVSREVIADYPQRARPRLASARPNSTFAAISRR